MYDTYLHPVYFITFIYIFFRNDIITIKAYQAEIKLFDIVSIKLTYMLIKSTLVYARLLYNNEHKSQSVARSCG